MTVKTYNKKVSGNIKLSDHFNLYEFASKDGSNTILIDDKLVQLLEFVRNYFGKPVIITSAYRSPAHNKKVGGSPNSQHVKGTAADIIVQGIDPMRVAEVAELFLGNTGGIGYYPISKFTHVDVRPNTSRWYEHKRSQVTVRGRFNVAEAKEEVEDMPEVKKLTVIINGKEQQIDGVFVAGSNYVSIRQLAKLLDCQVSNKGSVAVINSR